MCSRFLSLFTGSAVIFEDYRNFVMAGRDNNPPTLVCYHPHGIISVGLFHLFPLPELDGFRVMAAPVLLSISPLFRWEAQAQSVYTDTQYIRHCSLCLMSQMALQLRLHQTRKCKSPIVHSIDEGSGVDDSGAWRPTRSNTCRVWQGATVHQEQERWSKDKNAVLWGSQTGGRRSSCLFFRLCALFFATWLFHHSRVRLWGMHSLSSMEGWILPQDKVVVE